LAVGFYQWYFAFVSIEVTPNSDAVTNCTDYVFVSASGILGISIGLNAVSTHGLCTVVFAVLAAVLGFATASVRTLGRITWLAWVGLPCIIIAGKSHDMQSYNGMY
jgi:hypothetical protein